MGMVVLDELHRAVGFVLGPATGLVARVGVGRHHLGAYPVHLGELADRALEGGEGGDTAHVADVLAHPGVTTRGQAEGVLQLAASRHQGDGVEGQAHR